MNVKVQNFPDVRCKNVDMQIIKKIKVENIQSRNVKI